MSRPAAPPPPAGEGDINGTPRRAAWQARHLDATTRAALARDAAAFLHQSVSTPCLNEIVAAEGIWIEDRQGRRYMDFHGNNVHHLGHAHPEVVTALHRQLDALCFAPRRYACEPATRLAETLGQAFTRLGQAPGKVLLTPGGSEAVEVAIKLARVATGRFKTLSFWDAFHGAGFGAASVGGEAMFRAGALGPLLPGAEHVAPFACYRCPYGYRTLPDGSPPLADCRLTCARMVRYVLEREQDVAALIAEPARAVPYLPPPGFWREVEAACRDHGTLLIFDEIPTGLGKTGRFFAAEHDGARPDMVVLGKALGGGMLPLAAVIARADLDVAGDFALGHYTHEKNPLASQAALTTLAIIEREDLAGHAARLGEHALTRLRELQSRYPVIGDVRGRGLLLGLELVTDPHSRTPDPARAEALLYALLERGISCKTTLGNILSLSPPLIITQAQLDDALDRLEEALADVCREVAGDCQG